MSLVEESFDGDEGGFTYVDDAFRSTQQPDYANGEYLSTGGFSGGALKVTLGDYSYDRVNNMSGGWRRDFAVSSDGDITLSFRYNLSQEPNYESNEISQALLSVDGNLVGQGGNDYLAQIVGGGATVSTGWQQVVLNLGPLSHGTHTVTIGAFNNLKTYNDERTYISIDDMSISAEDEQDTETDSDPEPSTTLLSNDFNTSITPFVYLDDAFLGTNAPSYASGSMSQVGEDGSGALSVILGGKDNVRVDNMSGGFRASFDVPTAQHVTLFVKYNLTMAPGYESDELSQALISVDGNLIGEGGNAYLAQLDGSDATSTGWVSLTLSLGVLTQGSHQVTLGGYNNKKTWSDESTEIRFDDLLIQGEAGNRFLILVDEDLYQTGDISTKISEYMSDIENEGWSSELVQVGLGAGAPADCTDWQCVRDLIKSYYLQNYEGFVLIGSDLPVVYYEESGNIGPSDWLYADMDNWEIFDPNSNGAFETQTPPEMFFGRISAGGISANLTEEANRISSYFDRIHDYRGENGSALASQELERSLLMYDTRDYKNDKSDIAFLKSVAKEITYIADDSLTTSDRLADALEEGYQFASYSIHSGAGGHQIDVWPDNTGPFMDSFDIALLDSIMPRVHYVNMFSCSAAKYRDFTTGNKVANMGEAYLFNDNGEVFNVTGSTIPGGMVPETDFWNDLSTGVVIGKALQDAIFDSWGRPNEVLLGDPTLVYPVASVNNKMPHIDTKLVGGDGEPRAEAYVGYDFSINAPQWTDPEADPVAIEVVGLPLDAVTSVANGAFTWTPSSNDLGQTYTLTAKAYNEIGGAPVNGFTEEFSVSVPPLDIPNSGFESRTTVGSKSLPTSWWATFDYQVAAFGIDLSSDSSVKRSGLYSAHIDAPLNSSGKFQTGISVKPNTDYNLKGYIKTDNLTADAGYGARIVLQFRNSATQYTSASVSGTTDWQYVEIPFNSQDEAGVKISLKMGEGDQHLCSGKVWFDDLELESGNLLVNPSFENVTANMPDDWQVDLGWWLGSPPIFSADDAISYDGGYSAKITASNQADSRFVTTVTVTPNTEYELSGYVKTENLVNHDWGQAGANLTVKKGSTEIRSSPTVLGTNDWTFVSMAFNSENNQEIEVQARLGWSANSCTGTVWFDKLMLREVE